MSIGRGFRAAILVCIVLTGSIGGQVVAAESPDAAESVSDETTSLADSEDGAAESNTTTGNGSRQDGTATITQTHRKAGRIPNLSSDNESSIRANTIQRQVGTQVQFFVLGPGFRDGVDNDNDGNLNNPAEIYEQRTGVVEAVTPNAEIIVENGVANNPDVSQQDVNAAAEAFNQTVHPTVNNDYGTFNDINNDGRIAIYLTEVPGFNVFGYHDPYQYTNNQFSAQRDGFYMDYTNAQPGTDQFNETMAQEFAHAVIFNYDQNEELWLDEALANYAEYRTYQDTNQRRISGFEQNPQSLTEFDLRDGFINADYGASFAFATYLAEHYGGVSTLQELVRDTDNGVTSVNRVLNNNGYNERFPEVFNDWTVANRIDDDSVADEYGYSTFDIEIQDSATLPGSSVTQQTTVDPSGQTETDTVRRTTADYYLVNSNLESLYHELEVRGSDDDVELIIVAETASDGVVKTVSVNTSEPTAPQISEGLSNATDNQSSVQSSGISASVLSSPPITPENTITNADEYGEITVVLPNSAPNIDHNYELSIEPIPAQNQFSGTLDDGESAKYVIPVNKFGTPTLTSVYEYNGDVYTSVWGSDGEAQVDLSPKSGAAPSIILGRAGVPGNDLVGSNPLTASNVWVLETTNPSDGDGPIAFQAASRYKEGSINRDQIFTLPSDASVTVLSRIAGNASDPGSVAAEFSVESAGAPYRYTDFGKPDKSHVSVRVGNQKVNNLSFSRVNNRQDRYRIEFVAPEQQSAGNYDLTVEFTDEKFGVSGTAEGTATDAIEYTKGGGATGSTATAIIIDESGSMGSDQKIENAKASAKLYVSLLGPGDYAAVVGFDSGARTPAPMQRATAANKSDLRSGIDRLIAGGGTDIGDGMREAFPEFNRAPENTTKAAILLGDGRASYPSTQVQNYNNSDIPVCTIALGSNADRDVLRRIAGNTGCELREANSSNLQAIYNELSQNISGSSTVAEESGTIGNNSTVATPFKLDDSIDNANVRVNIGSASSASPSGSAAVTANNGPTTVRLLYPNGTVVPLNSSSPTGTDDPSITYNDLGDTITYQLSDPKAGEWATEIRNQQPSPVSYSSEVTASASATLSTTADGNEFLKGSATTLTATLVNNQGGISGATVTANVIQPDGTTDTVQLNETSSGTYRGQVVNKANGSVSATITATSQNFSRQESLSWSVVNQSSVLRISVVNNSTPTAAEGGSVDIAVNVTRPAGSSSTSVTTSTNASTETDDVESAFMTQVLEVAASEPGTYNPEDVDSAVLAAARALQNESNETSSERTNKTLSVADADRSVGVTASNTGAPVFVSASELTASSGATIPASAVKTSPSAVRLRKGAEDEVAVSVRVPDDTPSGAYNGTVTAVIDGKVVQTEYTMNVTEATAATYQNRIQQTARQWETAGPTGKRFYEGRIADSLTQIYFGNTSAGGSSTGTADRRTSENQLVSNTPVRASPSAKVHLRTWRAE
ncbi:vWA domain-containing protein [Halobellus ruber]|uniref:VWA domain-containing protein n=1 Tax=Halobellus ruber TaxID=2761102 RepID=A0A7J9SLT7_9EURY|nr:vWA domain-containing protein [Halobellus ruber]MBB6647343.1 VWA domain-containing protein [Halobellus ruber]